ncbi:MAG: hypothetical protein HQL16_02475 [Candidatus Omnitrophica bacterium]|nr:hypothetical protein [Candidatus Omnitrophota bacterium]
MFVYEDVFKALNKAKIKYVVAGGFAVILHGYPRYTGDLDLIVYLEHENLGLFFDVLKTLGYGPKVPVKKEDFQNAELRKRWKKEKGMLVFSFQDRNPPFHLIDMFLEEPIPFKEVFAKSVKAKYGSVKVPIIGIGHLLKLKDAAGRGKDLEDIVQLKAIQERRHEEERESKKKTRTA